MDKDTSNIIINIGASGAKPLGCSHIVVEGIAFLVFIVIVIVALEFFR